MKILAGILAGIGAIVFFIFRGMSSTDTVVTTAGTSNTNTNTSSTSASGHNEYDTTNTSIPAYTPPQVEERWKCIPYQQVGIIKADHSEADIKRFIDENNVSREQLGREWGETIPGTLVYAGLPNQLTIEWQDGHPYEVIERIRIEGDSSNWQTPQGIRIGTSLDELIAINGKGFDFYGFEWDYSGKVDNWRNGNIPEGIIVYLQAENPAAVFPELLGDSLFPTSHHKAHEAKLSVGAIEIRMRKGIHF